MFFVFLLFLVGLVSGQEALDSQCVWYGPALEVVCSHLNGTAEWPAASSWAQRRTLATVRTLKFEHLDSDGCGLHLAAQLVDRALPRLKNIMFPPGCDDGSSCVSVVDSVMLPVDWRFFNNFLCNFTTTTAAPSPRPNSAGMPTWATVLLVVVVVGGAILAFIFGGRFLRRKYCTEMGIDAAQNIPLRLFPDMRGGSYQALGVT